ncbi:MAG TPA: hypothetical protein PKK67_11440, partial [Cyclobacteriaceae bacterium]|nr:hypothetical protein [Cyclobacteriaceae bacterium]
MSANIFLLRKIRQIFFFARNRLSARQFMMLSCIVIGVLSALAGIVLKFIVHTIGVWVNHY